MSERADDQFEIVVEDEGIIGWLKMPFLAALAYLGIEVHPKTNLRILHRRTRRRILSQTYTRPAEASRAIERFEAELPELTVEEFLAKWAPHERPLR